MKWFKFYGQDYLSDPKMLSLNACERSCWITLLSYSSINDNGMIMFMSEQQLMLQAGLDFQDGSWDRTVGILKKLEKLEMITIDNEIITVKNWRKRQEISLTSYERVKRFREKQKNDNALKQNDNAMITLEENRREKNIQSIVGTSSTLPKSLKETPSKEKTPFHAEAINLITLYKTLFKEKVSEVVPIFNMGQAIKMARQRIATLGEERMTQLLSAYLESEDKFYKENVYSITCFLSEKVVNKLNLTTNYEK